MIRWLLIGAQGYAGYRLATHRLHRIFPQFACYLVAAMASNLSRSDPGSILYTQTIWAPIQTVVTIAMLGCTIEAYLGENEDRYGERFAFALILSGIAMPLMGLAYEHDDDGRWLALYVQIRAYAVLLVAGAFAVDVALVKLRRWHLPAAEYRHLLILAALFGCKGAAALVYLVAGKWRIPVSSPLWVWTDGITSAGAALCYVLWGWLIDREPLLSRDRAASELRYSLLSAIRRRRRTLAYRGPRRIGARQ